MARRSALSALLALSALVGAANAHAAPTTVARFIPSLGESRSIPYFSYTGAKLSGSSVAWARTLPAGGWVVERATTAGARARIATNPRPQVEVDRAELLGASATRVAWADESYDIISAHDGSSDTIVSQLRVAGVATGSTTTLAGCGDGLPPCDCPPYCGYRDHFWGDLDGDTVAYVEGRWDDATIVIDDLSSPADPIRLPRGMIIERLLVAGDLVGWYERPNTVGGEPDATVVYNWRTRQEVRRVPDVALAALQGDGKFATFEPEGDAAWYGPNDSTPHSIDIPKGRHILDLLLAGDRLFFTYNVGFYGAGATVSDLGGHMNDIASWRVADNSEGYLAADFDGRRATWMTRACGLVSVVLDTDITQPGGDPPPVDCVQPAITGIGFAPGGSIRARMVCEGGCRGTLSVYDLSSTPRRRLARRPVSLPARRRGRLLGLTPARADRKRIAKLDRLRVQVLFSGHDGRGRRVAAGDAGSLKRP